MATRKRMLGPRSSLISHTFPQFYACYLLKSAQTSQAQTVYIGSTPNPPRRIRQHNGELKQGAWKTRFRRPWVMQMIVHGFPSRLAALQFEWAWQHPHLSRHLREDDGTQTFTIQKPKRIRNSVRIVRSMITSHPYHLWPLHVKLFTAEAVTAWNESAQGIKKLPPGFICSVELEGVDGKSGSLGSGRSAPISVKDEEFTSSYLAKNTTMLASNRPLICNTCQGVLTNYADALTTALCPSPTCHAVYHLSCLSKHFLDSDPTNSGLIPRGGPCNSCNTYVLWGDVIRGCYRRKVGRILPEEEVILESDQEELSECASCSGSSLPAKKAQSLSQKRAEGKEKGDTLFANQRPSDSSFSSRGEDSFNAPKPRRSPKTSTSSKSSGVTKAVTALVKAKKVEKVFISEQGLSKSSATPKRPKTSTSRSSSAVRAASPAKKTSTNDQGFSLGAGGLCRKRGRPPNTTTPPESRSVTKMLPVSSKGKAAAANDSKMANSNVITEEQPLASRKRGRSTNASTLANPKTMPTVPIYLDLDTDAAHTSVEPTKTRGCPQRCRSPRSKAQRLDNTSKEHLFNSDVSSIDDTSPEYTKLSTSSPKKASNEAIEPAITPRKRGRPTKNVRVGNYSTIACCFAAESGGEFFDLGAISDTSLEKSRLLDARDTSSLDGEMAALEHTLASISVTSPARITPTIIEISD